MSSETSPLSTLHDIRNMMQRSSRFLSLSGLSGVAAGCCALIGAYIAYGWLNEYRDGGRGYTGNESFEAIETRFFLLAAGVFIAALLSASYFTWRRAGQINVPFWDRTTRMVVINILLPLVAGGFFILSFIQNGLWGYVAPGCLVFYGLALINCSKYTVRDIRYLGILEVVLGLISTQWMGEGLLFWAIGFGVLHVVYGLLMWYRYERKGANGGTAWQ